jgi:hypothetical protein
MDVVQESNREVQSGVHKTPLRSGLGRTGVVLSEEWLLVSCLAMPEKTLSSSVQKPIVISSFRACIASVLGILEYLVKRFSIVSLSVRGDDDDGCGWQ